MSRAKGGDRVLGPYPETKRGITRYRLHVHKGGKIARPVFDAREGPGGAIEAKAEIEMQLVAATGRTIEEAIVAWEESRRGELRPETLRGCAHTVRGFFAEHLDKPLAWLTATRSGQDRGAALYEAYKTRIGQKTGKKLSAATHKGALRISKQFLAWCAGNLPRPGAPAPTRWLSSNPLGDVKPNRKERTNRRKAQLTIDEGRVFFAKADEMATGGDIGAVAVMTALLLSLRQGELTDRVVRDLDDNGRKLRIDSGKTEASKGTVEVPEIIRPHLQRLARGKTPLAPLFESTSKGGHAFSDTWLRDQVHRVCVASGVGLQPGRPQRDRVGAVRLPDGGLHGGRVTSVEDDGSIIFAARGQEARRLAAAAPGSLPFAVEWLPAGRVRLRFPPGTEALLPVITAHSLRGMAASYLRSTGAAPHIIAQALRHADKGRVATQHYIDPKVAAGAERAALAEMFAKEPADGGRD
jgi:integrase